VTASGGMPAAGTGSWPMALLLPALAAALYLTGWRVLTGRGTAWPRARVAAAAGGLGAAAAALSPPVAGRAGYFPVHVGQHLVLVMLVPLLLAWSAPLTLALRTLPRPLRRGLLRGLHSGPLRVLTAPAPVVVLELGSLAALYLTPLYGRLHEWPLLHLAVHAHMLLAGCLVSWLLAGVDPMPGRPGTPVRVVTLVVLAAGHGMLAKLLYAAPPAALGAAGEVRAGAQLLFYGGDAIELLLAVAVMTEWYRRTGRQLRAEQRRAARPVLDAPA
jgi:putative membrane protein